MVINYTKVDRFIVPGSDVPGFDVPGFVVPGFVFPGFDVPGFDATPKFIHAHHSVAVSKDKDKTD